MSAGQDLDAPRRAPSPHGEGGGGVALHAEDDAVPPPVIVPAAPGWRAALFDDFAFHLIRGEGRLPNAATATEADLMSVMEIAPVLAWVATQDGMRPATAKGIWTDRAASMLLLAPAGEYAGVLLDNAPDGDVATARDDAELFAWARNQLRLRLRRERVEEALLRGEGWPVFEDAEPEAPVPPARPSARADEAGLRAAVLRLKGEKRSIRQIAAALGVGKAVVERLLREAKASGQDSKTPDPRHQDSAAKTARVEDQP